MSQASASVSGAGLVLDVIPGSDTRAKSAMKISGTVGSGIGMGFSSPPTSGVGSLEPGVKGSVDTGKDDMD